MTIVTALSCFIIGNLVTHINLVIAIDAILLALIPQHPAIKIGILGQQE